MGVDSSKENKPTSREIFVKRLYQHRMEKGYSLQDLADISNVSKSMISKIERREVQPTIDTAMRLAEGLGTTLSELVKFEQYSHVVKRSADEHDVVFDEKENVKRIILTPIFSDSSTVIHRVLLPGHSTLGSFPPHHEGVKEYVLMLKGRLNVKVGDEEHSLRAGDTLYYEAHFTHSMWNPGSALADYIVVIERR